MVDESGLTPDQIKMLTLQFMGQHLTGDLKELDKNLVAKNNTLQGMSLDPAAVLKTIAPIAPQQVPVSEIQYNVPQPVPAVSPTAPQYIAPVVQQAVTPTPETNQDQLEFSFNTSPYTVSIFEKLSIIEKKLSTLLSIEERLSNLEESLKDVKKKD